MKKSNRLYYPIIILLLYAATGCNTSTKISNGIESFDTFYDRFHTDSLFQISRIQQPLEGSRFDGDLEIKWTIENQPFLTTRIYDVDTSEYKTSYKKTKNEFIEKVWIENSGFWSEYKFRVITDKWYLVSAVEQDI
jgi:hypothetical protein